MNIGEKENIRYIVLYLSKKNNILKTCGTFWASEDESAYKKAQSILPQFKEEMQIAMCRLNKD